MLASASSQGGRTSQHNHPPGEIAKRLNRSPSDDLCVVRQRVRYIDSKPAIISDDYFDERLVRSTELGEPRDTTREDFSPKPDTHRRTTSTRSSHVCLPPQRSIDCNLPQGPQ